MIVSVQLSFEKGTSQLRLRSFIVRVRQKIRVFVLEEYKEFDVHMSVNRNIITNYSQQDAVFIVFIYFYKRCTCFRRILRPSSGAHNCTYSFRYCQPILLLAAAMEEMELT
jgi:hypothetical protein